MTSDVRVGGVVAWKDVPDGALVREGLRSTNFARERTARIFANEWAVKLRAVIEAGGAAALEPFLKGVPDEACIAEQARMPVRVEGELCPLDLVNFVLMHLGGGVGVTLLAGDKGVVQTAFTPHAPGPTSGHDLESLAARLEDGGGACTRCRGSERNVSARLDLDLGKLSAKLSPQIAELAKVRASAGRRSSAAASRRSSWRSRLFPFELLNNCRLEPDEPVLRFEPHPAGSRCPPRTRRGCSRR